MIIVIVVLVLSFVYWRFWARNTKRMEKMTESLPEAPSLPLVGSATQFIGDSEKLLQNLEDLAKLALDNKGAVKIWFGPKLYIAIGNAEDAQVVLENCLDKDIVYRFLQPWLGYGLFVAPVGLWKTHRKVLLPIFHNKIVEEYLEIIAEQSDVLVQRLASETGKGEFDILKYVSACTLDIVFETAMGERMDVQHTPDTPYLRARHTVMTILNMRFFKMWLQPDMLFNFTTYAKQQKDNIELTHKFTDEVVKKKRLEFEDRRHSVKSEEATKSKVRSVLDLLFGREIEFTDEQLREHIDSITIAGNDTTALVIAYTLVLLGVHQEAQMKVYQEQEMIFGNTKRGCTKADLQKMNYLERVIKESMRLYTVVPIIARNVEQDTFLPGCGVTVPAGAGAVIGAFAIHRCKKIWGPNVDQFDPDRFLPENSLNRHPAAFIPFSYGSRNCIGRNFGMLIMKSIISTVIRSYKIESQGIGRLKIEMLLFPINGHLIKVQRR